MDLYLDVNNKCNRGSDECRYCLRRDNYSSGSRMKHKALNQEPLLTEDMMQIIENVRRYSRTGLYGSLNTVHLSGGEPLVDAEPVLKLANYCRDRGLRVRLFTNGDALHDTGLLQQLYEGGVSTVQVGVHDFRNLDSLFGILDEKKQDDSVLFLDFIMNNSTRKYLSPVMQQLAGLGADFMKQRNIYAKFYDMAPLSEDKDVLDLALKDSNAKDELDELYHNLFPDSASNIQLMHKYEYADRPSSCSERQSVYVDNYGDIGFCFGVHGNGNNWFGNAKTDNLSRAINRKEILFQIFSLYDKYLVPYELAKGIAFEKHGINYDDWFRPYCSRILRDLFNNHKRIEELANAFQKKYDELWMKVPEFSLRALNREYDLFHKFRTASGSGKQNK